MCILHAFIFILQNSPRIAQSSLPYVHHMVFYQCAFLNETTDLGPGGHCDTEFTVSENIQKCKVPSTWLAAWAVGGDVSLTTPVVIESEYAKYWHFYTLAHTQEVFFSSFERHCKGNVPLIVSF